MTIKMKGCPHCGGDLSFDKEEKRWQCIQCSRTFTVQEIMERDKKIEEPVKPKRGFYHRNPRSTFLDQHRDEILADRLSLGHHVALTKWEIELGVWPRIRRRWLDEGVKISDLRIGNKRHQTPTVRAEHEKSARILSSEDKIEITVERLEEILRELEWFKGYRQAVLDICGQRSIDLMQCHKA